MYKIIFDSDGIIKITKSGFGEKILEHFNCIISKEVYQECVIEGKKHYYDDAFKIEEFTKIGILKIKRAVETKESEEILFKTKSLGIGEISSLKLFISLRADTIVSDDKTFVNLLFFNEIPYILPIDLIVRCYELKILSKDDTLYAIENIRYYVTESSYLKAKIKLEVNK